VTEEQIARLIEARDDAQRAYRSADSDISRAVAWAQVETFEAIARVFDVDLGYFNPYPGPKEQP